MNQTTDSREITAPDRIDWSVFDGVSCVFWMCGDHETESVTWDRTETGMVPHCDRCGKTGDPR